MPFIVYLEAYKQWEWQCDNDEEPGEAREDEAAHADASWAHRSVLHLNS